MPMLRSAQPSAQQTATQRKKTQHRIRPNVTLSVTKRNKTQHRPSALRKIEQHINHRADVALSATLSATKRNKTQRNATLALSNVALSVTLSVT